MCNTKCYYSYDLKCSFEIGIFVLDCLERALQCYDQSMSKETIWVEVLALVVAGVVKSVL